MVSTLYRFHCDFLKDTLRKILVLIINFFSLNFTGIEIEGERVSSCQNERTLRWGGGGGVGGREGRKGSGLEKELERTRGEKWSKLGDLERTYFLNVPLDR